MKILNNIHSMYTNLDGSSQILLFLIVLVLLMLLSIFIINGIIRKKNTKYYTLRNFDKLDKYIQTSSTKKVTKTPKIEIKHEEPIKPKNVEIKKEVIKQEINKPVKEEDEEEIIEVISDDNSIDKIATLLEDGINNPKPIDLTAFEEEEEKNAIISYDELVKKAGAKKIVYKTEKATVNEIRKEEKIEIKDSNSKFKASEIISPIYGRRKQADEIEQLDETVPVLNDDELQKDITFLTNLKTFRSNLD